jgi:hypothetical protein
MACTRHAALLSVSDSREPSTNTTPREGGEPWSGAHLKGQILQAKEDLVFKEVSLWHTQVIDFIGTAWGVTYSTPFVSDIGRPIAEASGLSVN